MNIYQLATEYKLIFDSAVNEETGEMTEDFFPIMDGMKDTITQKAIALAAYIKNLEAEQLAIEEAMRAMKQRRDRLDSKSSQLTDWLKSALLVSGISEIKDSPYFKIKIRTNPPKVLVDEHAELDDKYKTYKTSIVVNKDALKKDLQSGMQIEGVSLVQEKRLEIK